jgi:hypothetical protein
VTLSMIFNLVEKFTTVILEIGLTSTLFDYLPWPHCQAFGADHLLGPHTLSCGPTCSGPAGTATFNTRGPQVNGSSQIYNQR